ncbi:MAG: excinuclease ABC subunit UvrC [Chitinophagaceae bacterium]
MTKEEYLIHAPFIPKSPGVYKYFDKNNSIIYVGKAKNLKNRISSYFNKNQESYKTFKLVSEIAHFEYVLVDSEQDALLLENSLIKKLQPKYNISLKDDKSYPYLVIRNEEYPRVYLTRQKRKDGSIYIGPFPSMESVREMMHVIKQTIPLRTCSLVLSEKNIQKQKFKPCLEYHIGNCKAPCVGYQNKEEYDWYIAQIKELFKGKHGELIKRYQQEMKVLAERMEFEKAALIKNRIQHLQNYQSKSIIVSNKNINVDVCSIKSNSEMAIVNFMMVDEGNIIHSRNHTIEKKLQESDAEILSFLIPVLHHELESRAKEIVADIAFDLPNTFTLTIPKLGDKKALLELSTKNTLHSYHDYRQKKALLLEDQSEQKLLDTLQSMQQLLHLKQVPLHIECFDNSNFQGSYPVSAMVCFKNGKPSKQEYRHYNIKTVEGINDFASMQEVVYRRYDRLLRENKALPQLIIIDGGKGQLSAAMESIDQLGLRGKINVVGLAKNVEELFFPNDKESLKLPFQSDTLNLIKFIRDEVHRFGITFHRKKRSKGIIKNELTTIDGIGEKTAELLLKKFKSVSKIRLASQQELIDIIGKSKTDILIRGLGLV